MFQFPRFPSIRYGLAYGYLRFAQVGFPIRISPDQWIFAPPRSFSQLITSFIGSQCQGIHPALLMLDLYSWSAAIIALMTGFCVLCFKSNWFNNLSIISGLITSHALTHDASDVFSYLERFNVFNIDCICGFQGTSCWLICFISH